MTFGRLAGGRGADAASAARARAGRPVGLAALLLGAALALWIVTVERMAGMDAGPGTDLGAIGWFLGVWVTMMAAMMLPSVAPMVLIFHRISAERSRRGQSAVPTWVFLAGYLAAWTAYGLAAYGIFRAVSAVDPAFLAWDRQGPVVAGGAVVAAGVYQLTPLKRACLGHCRSPLHFVMHGWRAGHRGALRMGLEHGAWCVGCCWGLMLILIALGVMSVVWMAVVAGLIFAEKVLPFGERIPRVLAVALIGAGLWIALAPGSVPGLTEPTSMPAMPMEESMPMSTRE
jgi:predicted metal-binding membrane protein